MKKKEAEEIAKEVRDSLTSYDDIEDEMGYDLYSFDLDGVWLNVFAYIKKARGVDKKNGMRYRGDVETYGGKLVENIVQATARDCLAEVMKRVSSLGYKIVMHVHDEIIVDVPNEDKDAPAKITAIMGEPISWALDLPLKGETYETDFYKKD